MSRDDQAYIHDIILSARLIASYTRDRAFSDFEADTAFQDAVIRRLSIIGEAVRGLSPQAQAQAPQVPWRQIVHARNIMIHVYHGVDLERAWQMATIHVPDLLVALAQAFPDISGSAQ